MSNDVRNRILWSITLLFAVFSFLKATPAAPAMMAFIPAVSILVPTLFAVLHGTRRMGARNLLVFFVITFMVSWGFESLSIVTGFPFGHYHYTDRMGPKLGLVPMLIMPAYFAVCYLSWTLAHVALDKFNQRADELQRLALPLLAAFIMVMWDMSMDPARSTLAESWIWHQGGSYFGVPFSNFMGWFLCVYVIFQLLAFYLARSGGQRDAAISGDDRRTHWHQVTALYGATFIEFPAFAWLAPEGTVTDPAGVVWSIRAMYETLGLVSLFTMLFVTCLAYFKVRSASQLS